MKKSKYELLAPVGDFPMLAAAVNAGADAVYFGLKEFSMRANAKNFGISDLPQIRKVCDASPRKVKMFLTLNTIIYDKELGKMEKVIKKVKGKVDAVICWDLSVVMLCKKHKIPFFISTQASVANKEAALFYKKLGAKRVVLARELDLKQVKEISNIIDVEVFCHGAMCVAVSGRCFMSQFTFGKSANRGECLQNCRRTYIVKSSEQSSGIERPSVVIRDKQEGFELELDNDTVLSAKDLCTLPFIEKMKSAGIMSFKIEGRNRDPRYVDTVVRAYRKALDKKLSRKEIEEGMVELKKVYNRGFSSGFYLGLPGADDFAKKENNSATEKKHFVGKITHYFNKVNVAAIKLSSELNVGDDILIIGSTTGIVKSSVERIEIDRVSVKKASKGQYVGIKLPLVRRNDEVYVVVKN